MTISDMTFRHDGEDLYILQKKCLYFDGIPKIGIEESVVYNSAPAEIINNERTLVLQLTRHTFAY